MITGIPLVDGGIALALILLVLLLLPITWRLWRGPEAADRLQALEALTTVFIAIIVVLALVQQQPALIDAGLALALFAFVGTLAIARYLNEGRVF